MIPQRAQQKMKKEFRLVGIEICQFLQRQVPPFATLLLDGILFMLLPVAPFMGPVRTAGWSSRQLLSFLVHTPCATMTL